jgi:tripartite-type tricarboxylate transporter receptor subunit TctC
MQRRTVIQAAAGLALGAALPSAFAQASGPWPNRPIKLIVPFPAGISPDVVARVIGDKLGHALGQPVIIDNRPGAGGMIGAEAAAAAPADGYNLFFPVKSVMAIAPHVYTTAKYNPLKDFKAVTQILVVPHIITATPNAPYKTMQEMVDYAKKNPGKIDYASLGVGSQPHVALEAWAKRLGIQLNHIPYKSNPAPDVMSGTVSLYLEASTTSIPSIQGGKVRGLVVSGKDRVSTVPDIPTMTEYRSDLDPNGIIGNSWHGIFAPTGTSDEIVTRLNTELVKIVRMPDVQARLISLGLTPTGTSAATLTTAMAGDYDYWGKLVRELNVKVE